MLDQNQQRSAAADQLGFLVLCENLAGVLNRPWLDYVEASHFTPRTRSAGVLECWSDLSNIPSLHYSKPLHCSIPVAIPLLRPTTREWPAVAAIWCRAF